MDNKPDLYYGPPESVRPDPKPKKEKTGKSRFPEGYFDPKTAEDHRKHCIAIQRRGTHQRQRPAEACLELDPSG